LAKTEISGTMEGVLKDVDRLTRELQKVGKKAVQEGDWARTRVVIETATRIDRVRASLQSAGDELDELYDIVSAHLEGGPVGRSRRTTKRIPRGSKTAETAYWDPILKALDDMGGKAKTSEVLDRVYELMKSTLNEFDRQPVPSVPSQQRWRHTAQIVRNKMVKEGLIKKDSPRGVWEITDMGTRAAASGTVVPTKKAGPKKAPKKKK